MLMDGIFLVKDLVIAKNAQGLNILRPDTQLAAAFGTRCNNIRHDDYLRTAGFPGFMF